MTTITITECQTRDELYHRYPRETSAQDCYVELDCRTGRLSADWNGEIGNAVPADEWHGHVQCWSIGCLRAAAANDLLHALAPLAQRVVDGYDDRWDGSNHVARFTDDADDAREEIARLCERASEDPTDQVNAWEAVDWLGALGGAERQCDELGITAATTDAELAAIETECLEQARGEGVDVIEGLDRHLAWLRDQARDAADEARA